MRLVKIGNIRKKENGNSRAKSIYRLIKRGSIKGYQNQDGCMMYDRDELAAYLKKEHRGRPRKEELDLIEVDLRKGKR